jgi:hypothetical protein
MDEHLVVAELVLFGGLNEIVQRQDASEELVVVDVDLLEGRPLAVQELAFEGRVETGGDGFAEAFQSESLRSICT